MDGDPTDKHALLGALMRTWTSETQFAFLTAESVVWVLGNLGVDAPITNDKLKALLTTPSPGTKQAPKEQTFKPAQGKLTDAQLGKEWATLCTDRRDARFHDVAAALESYFDCTSDKSAIHACDTIASIYQFLVRHNPHTHLDPLVFRTNMRHTKKKWIRYKIVHPSVQETPDRGWPLEIEETDIEELKQRVGQGPEYEFFDHGNDTDANKLANKLAKVCIDAESDRCLAKLIAFGKEIDVAHTLDGKTALQFGTTAGNTRSSTVKPYDATHGVVYS